MDRLLREGNPPTGQLASPKPQYKKPGVDEYEPVEGQHGAPFATLKDASGNVVSPATEDKLEQVRQLLTGVATEAKLEQARVLLNAISNKDFATQATLEVVQSELALIKSELANIKANQLSGDQKVTLSGTNVEILPLMPGVISTVLAPGEFYETVVDMQGFTQWWFQSYVSPATSQIIRVTFSDREGDFSTLGYNYRDEWSTDTDGQGEELRKRVSGSFIALATPQLVRARWMQIQLQNGASVDATWRNPSIVRVKGGIAHG